MGLPEPTDGKDALVLPVRRDCWRDLGTFPVALAEIARWLTCPGPVLRFLWVPQSGVGTEGIREVWRHLVLDQLLGRPPGR